VKIGNLVNVFAVGFLVFVVAGCIVYVLAVVVSFIVVFLYCVCALFVCYFVRFEVFTAVTMKNGVFWVVTPCVLLVCCIVVLLPPG
jgi:hypothetical protein